jgi:hypothetical protein
MIACRVKSPNTIAMFVIYTLLTSFFSIFQAKQFIVFESSYSDSLTGAAHLTNYIPLFSTKSNQPTVKNTLVGIR